MKEKMMLLATKYGEYFNTYGEERGFDLIRFDVVINILNNIYKSFIHDGIAPIEKIPQHKKIKYFNLSCNYFDDREKRIKASKAAYVLELITSNY